MPINTKVTIEIAQETLSSFSDLKITQKSNDHHHFTITRTVSHNILADAIEKTKDYMGQSLRISIEANTMKTNSLFEFYGIVTNTELVRSNGASGEIIIQGFSPTVFMDGNRNTKSFNDKTLGDIIREITANYPQNELKASIDLDNDASFPYIVQYKESDYSFLSRLLNKTGNWFYYNNSQTIYGRLKSKTINLTYGQNLHKFSIDIQSKPLGFEFIGYDPSTGEIQKANSNELNFQTQGYTKSAFDTSKQMYPNVPTDLYSNPLQEGMSRTHLVNRATTQLESKTAGLVVAKGECDETGIRIGDVIVIRESNFSPTGNPSDGVKEQNFGSYIVTKLIHTCDVSGRYSNSFEAIPDSALSPPYSDIFQIPLADTQPAVVKDNNDPKGLGRVQVQMAWQKDINSHTPWIRMTNPHAGGGKGMYFIPEIGEEVLVGFENNNAEKPYVLGAMYNGNEKSGFATPNNDFKVTQTRTGIKIVMNDASKSLLAEDPSGNSIFMDGQGNMTLNAPKNMTINVGEDLTINVGKNMTTTVGSNMDTQVGEDKTTKVSKKNTLKASEYKQDIDENKTVVIGGDLKETTGTTTHKALSGDILIQSSGISKMLGAVDAKVNKG
ncbi:type VI secretion system Vgr family protein [Flavobacterium sp.]|uniref:type VI secretion system Vgr family protein n=1 Tax=Flavobacterium sp. TaxID=239 RepID=UPI00374FEC0F